MAAERNPGEDGREAPVITEEIKKRPLTPAVFAARAGVFVLAALLFGSLARLAFDWTGLLTGQRNTGPSDPVSAAVLNESRTENAPETGAVYGPSSDGSEAAEAAEPVMSGASSADSFEGREYLEHLRELNGFLNDIGTEVKRSMVLVTGFTDKADWFSSRYPAEISASGLIVSRDDERLAILTYLDVVENRENILVTFPDGEICSAGYVDGDELTGIAVISVPCADLSPETAAGCTAARLSSGMNPDPGDYVIAIGSPLGYSEAIEFGTITSTDLEVSVMDDEYNMIVTNILGSSVGSGVLANLEGEVAGWISRPYENHEAAVVKAVPIRELKGLINNLILERKTGYAGISGRDVTAGISKATGIPEGVYVVETGPDSPAVRAGITEGDIITEVNGLPVADMNRISEMIAASSPGDSMKVRVLREGADGYASRTFTITIGERT
ncbi:MAG: PDZ domain-containing protein [Lachnospiraceae bacterium]|nr:PDZ domain-containing protein [Lachnospiraceae bacterium]